MALHKYCFLPCISVSKSFPHIQISLSSLQGTLLNPTRDLWTKRQGSLHIHQHQRIWAGHPQQALPSERRRKGGTCQALLPSNFEMSLCRHSEGPWFGLGNVPWWGCCSALWGASLFSVFYGSQLRSPRELHSFLYLPWPYLNWVLGVHLP